MQQFDYLVFIGRFQPFHAGHKTVMDSALSLSKRVIIVLGSHNQPRSFTNMWLSHERQHMILSCYSKEEQSRIDFAYQETFAYNNNKWVASIQNQVDDIIHKEGQVGSAKVGLIGHAKDYTSYYLKLFPTWKSVNVDSSILTSATDTRVELMEASEFKGHNLLPKVTDYINWWIDDKKDDYALMKKEYEHIKAYKESWKPAPYAPTFVTADSVVVQSGHILLVTRKFMPGEGLLALPGGFIKEYELVVDAVIRELKEETKLKVPIPVLKGSIKEIRVFDDPYRSQRGRTITHAAYIHLQDATELPKVTARDDAKYAAWYELGTLQRNTMFEDHYDIIDEMVNL